MSPLSNGVEGSHGPERESEEQPLPKILVVTIRKMVAHVALPTRLEKDVVSWQLYARCRNDAVRVQQRINDGLPSSPTYQHPEELPEERLQKAFSTDVVDEAWLTREFPGCEIVHR